MVVKINTKTCFIHKWVKCISFGNILSLFMFNLVGLGLLSLVCSPQACASNVLLVEEMVNAHAAVVNSLIATADRIKTENAGALPEAYRASFQATLNTLAEREAEAYKSLSADERAHIKEHLATLGDTFERVLEFTKSILPESTQTDQPLMHTASSPKRAYIIGFLVCHRRCCENNAGNGVALCGGPGDCYHGSPVISDSCPECNWCSWTPNAEHEEL